jgi:hypothetical protein
MPTAAPRSRRRRRRPWRARKRVTARRRARQIRRRVRASLARRRVRALPWWERWPLEFHALFGNLPREYHGFEIHGVSKALICTGSVEVDDIGERTVTVIFPGRPSRVRPIVMADGSERSRHRFRRYRISDLCLYFSGDPDNLRWTPRHRLTGLLDLTRVHLLKEAWWRLTERWPSPEVHRDPDERSAVRGKTASTDYRGRSRRLRYERRTCWCGSRRYTRCHGAISAADERDLLGLR